MLFFTHGRFRYPLDPCKSKLLDQFTPTFEKFPKPKPQRWTSSSFSFPSYIVNDVIHCHAQSPCLEWLLPYCNITDAISFYPVLMQLAKPEAEATLVVLDITSSFVNKLTNEDVIVSSNKKSPFAGSPDFIPHEKNSSSFFPIDFLYLRFF